METRTLDTTYAANLITISTKLANDSMQYFMSRWKFVPEDKTNWMPGGKAKSPLQVAAHVAVTNEMFARSLGGKPPVEGDIGALFAWMAQEEAKITSRAEVEQRLASSLVEINQATSAISPEMVASSEQAQFYLGLIGRHMMDHAGQLDAYQLMWGDEDFHFEM